jgi:translation initiation factor IF-2
MRKRGAQLTDIAVLVVAADDGVQEQTFEAIKHIQEAKLPMIVALNKIDKRDADPEKVKIQLNKAGIQLEDFGGEIPSIPISGLTGKGVEKLQELIATQAGLMDLRADRKGPAEAAVIESRKDNKLGVVVKTLVQIGTLKRNDIFVCGETWGKVRWLFDAEGKRVEEALPGFPYDVHGFETVPEPGDTLIVVEDESTAQSIAEFRKAERADNINQQAYLEQQKRRHSELLREEEDRKRAIELGEDEDAFLRKQQRIRDEKSIRDIPVMVKGDVGGSLEAIRDAINQIPQTEFRIRIVNAGVGAITERDIDDATLAEPRCIILGFNVSLPQRVRDLAAKAGVEVQSFRVIFGLVDWLKGALEKQLKPREEVSVNGRAKVPVTCHYKVDRVTNLIHRFCKCSSSKAPRRLRSHTLQAVPSFSALFAVVMKYKSSVMAK